jgi:hypothetical protein
VLISQFFPSRPSSFISLDKVKEGSVSSTNQRDAANLPVAEPDIPNVDSSQLNIDTQEVVASASSLIQSFSLVQASSSEQCISQTLWNAGEQIMKEFESVTRCFSIGLTVNHNSDVILLQMVTNQKPRALLVENCRPVGYADNQLGGDETIWFPRTVEGNRGGLKPVFGLGTVRYAAISKSSGSDNSLFNKVSSSVSTLCGQQASISNDEMTDLLLEIDKQIDMSVKMISVVF